MHMLEAGVELDVAQLRETGFRAFVIAITGTVLPLVLGVGLVVASGQGFAFRSALAIGASFCPTSLGVAAAALKVREEMLWAILEKCKSQCWLALILTAGLRVHLSVASEILAHLSLFCTCHTREEWQHA